MTARRSAWALVASSLVLSSCGLGAPSAHSSSKEETPVQLAKALFGAINSHDVAAARQLFEPSHVDQIAWMNQPAADQSKFTDIRCHATSLGAKSAAVLCTFSESASPTEGNPSTFWTISFHRTAGGGWLIDNYGQG
ncbi:MAG TPA: hypothetical protein VMU98_01010 [Acidimicrobiales bacterium]|nr:hypothetical protein [Acidimicrobiales bacterium]